MLKEIEDNTAYTISTSDVYHTYGQCGRLKSVVYGPVETTEEKMREKGKTLCENCQRLSETTVSRLEYKP